MLPTIKRAVHQLIIVFMFAMMLIQPDTTRAASRSTPSPIEARVSAAPISDFPHCTDWSVAQGGADTVYTTFTPIYDRDPNVGIREYDLKLSDPTVQ